MPRVKHFTLEERKEIEKLIKSGFRFKEISIKLNRTYSSIKGEKRRCPDEYNAEKAHNSYLDGIRRRIEKVRRPLTDLQIKKMEKMVSQKKTISSIRLALGCSYDRVKAWINKNAEGYVGGKVSCLEDRLTNIEQQIEIIFEILKEKT
jgi:IS30 family transposase